MSGATAAQAYRGGSAVLLDRRSRRPGRPAASRSIAGARRRARPARSRRSTTSSSGSAGGAVGGGRRRRRPRAGAGPAGRSGGQRGLDLGPELVGLAADGPRSGGRAPRPRSTPRKRPGGEEALGPGAQPAEDRVGPGQGELVAGGQVAGRLGRGRRRRGGARRPCGSGGGGAGAAGSARAPRPAGGTAPRARRSPGGRRRAAASGAVGGASGPGSRGGSSPGRAAGPGRPRRRARARSRRSMRSSRAAGEVSSSGRVTRTSATSSGMRGSGASRMSSEGLAQQLQGPHGGRGAEAPALLGHPLAVACRAGTRVGRQRRRGRRRAGAPSSVLGERPGVAARARRPGPRRPGPGRCRARTAPRRSSSTDGVVVDLAAGGHDLVERRQRVAGRARAPPHGQVDARSSGTSRPASSTTQRTCSARIVGGQQVELEVLGAAADGGQHLLRVGGGQHEHHVGGRLLERLQQRVRRRRR